MIKKLAAATLFGTLLTSTYAMSSTDVNSNTYNLPNQNNISIETQPTVRDNLSKFPELTNADISMCGNPNTAKQLVLVIHETGKEDYPFNEEGSQDSKDYKADLDKYQYSKLQEEAKAQNDQILGKLIETFDLKKIYSSKFTKSASDPNSDNTDKLYRGLEIIGTAPNNIETIMDEYKQKFQELPKNGVERTRARDELEEKMLESRLKYHGISTFDAFENSEDNLIAFIGLPGLIYEEEICVGPHKPSTIPSMNLSTVVKDHTNSERLYIYITSKKLKTLFEEVFDYNL